MAHTIGDRALPSLSALGTVALLAVLVAALAPSWAPSPPGQVPLELAGGDAGTTTAATGTAAEGAVVSASLSGSYPELALRSPGS